MTNGYDLVEREKRLREIFESIPEEKRVVVEPLLDDIIFLERQLHELKRYPMIKVHPKNPAMQKVTPAAKLFKEYMQSYLNAIKVIQKTLYLAGETGESPLLKALKEFESNEDIS